MSLGKVNNVDIIADSSSVGSIVIISVNAETRKLSRSHLRNIRQEVIGYTVGVFAQKAALMSPYWVKVPKQNNAPIGVS